MQVLDARLDGCEQVEGVVTIHLEERRAHLVRARVVEHRHARSGRGGSLRSALVGRLAGRLAARAVRVERGEERLEGAWQYATLHLAALNRVRLSGVGRAVCKRERVTARQQRAHLR